MSENHSHILGPFDLDLWTSNPKIDRDHLIAITNQYVKHTDLVIKSFQDNERKQFL